MNRLDCIRRGIFVKVCDFYGFERGNITRKRDLTEELMEVFDLIKKVKPNHGMHEICIPGKPVYRMHGAEHMMLGCIHNAQEELSGASDLKVSDIAKMMYLSPSAVSKMLNQLESKGLIERFSDKTDRRVVYVRLSEVGVQEFAAMHKNMQLFTKHLVEQLGRDETESLIKVLRHLLQIIKNTKINDMFGNNQGEL
jgi:DNA-binding MarR family transcriptional regulator